MSDDNLTYSQSGVDYSLLDELKRIAQRYGRETAGALQDGYIATEYAGGESACFIRGENDQVYAFVQEGLGTKNLVADEMFKITGKSYYDSIAQDTIAMIVNDLITIGAKPRMITAYWAIGSTKWLRQKQRRDDLARGWRDACIKAECFWGGGETPILSGIIKEETIDLAGAAFGTVDNEKLILNRVIQAGDAILVFESSGIHANGLTLARQIADKLPDGYKTKIDSNVMYGEALLTPTIIYAKLINDLLDQEVDIHYMVNITGHGWRKLMRASRPFTYRITQLPPVPEVFKFIQEKGPVSEKEMYANFNMGAGYAIFVPQKSIGIVKEVAAKHDIKVYEIGIVELGEKQIIIEPKNITYKADSLQVKAK